MFEVRFGVGNGSAISSLFSNFELRISNFESGGDERIRTADPLLARQVLSQLSYIPSLEVGS
jgi:hypothetical protein